MTWRGEKTNKNSVSQQGAKFYTGATLASMEQIQFRGGKYVSLGFEGRGEKDAPVQIGAGGEASIKDGTEKCVVIWSSCRSSLRSRPITLVGISFVMYTGLGSGLEIPLLNYLSGMCMG